MTECTCENAPVTLFFEGVMIGRCDEVNSIFEMGILPVPNHSFSITVEEHGFGVRTSRITFNETEIPPDMIEWRLEVPEKDAADARRHTPLPDKPDRTVPPTNPAGAAIKGPKLDFRWVPDLADSRDFPNHVPAGETELPRFRGLLKPVIRFTTGCFYVSSLSLPEGLPRLKRRQGNGPWQCFGFVPEQVAADLCLEPGQQVVLKIVSSDEEIFRLRVQPGKTYKVFFRNEPPEGAAQSGTSEGPGPTDFNRPTHFQLNYLFVNLEPNNRYEVRYRPDQRVCDDEIESPPIGLAKSYTQSSDEAEAEGLTTPDAAETEESDIGVPIGRCAPQYVTSSRSLLE